MESLIARVASQRHSSLLGRRLHQWIPHAVAEFRSLGAAPVPPNHSEVRRLFSSSGSNKKHDSFRRPKKGRGTSAKGAKGFPFGHETIEKFGDRVIELGDDYETDDDMSNTDRLSAEFGPHLAGHIRQAQAEQNLQKGRWDTADDFLRGMDYLTSADGSTEDLVGERRALSFECETEEEKQQFLDDIDDIIERQRIKELGLEPYEDPFKDDGSPNPESVDLDEDPRVSINPNQLAHGEWGELLIRVDRNIKLWRGGRIQSYRALVIGGNLNGCAGFGTGKAPGAREAVLAASRKCKRNIFFVDRYQTNALTRDLVGRSNSCKVVLRATNRGLRGNPLSCEILKYFGITNCTAKAVHGNRSQFNVVRATFKALMTHESMEEVARKRGRRIVSLDRGRRMQL